MKAFLLAAVFAAALSAPAHACSIFDDPGAQCLTGNPFDIFDKPPPSEPQKSYQGVALSDGKEEVHYKLGVPDMVEEPEGVHFWRLYTVAAPVSDTANALPPGRYFSSFDAWEYNLQSGDLTVLFDRGTGKVLRVTCMNSPSCEAAGGVRIGTLKDALRAHLGAPTSEKLENGAKTLTYAGLNFRFVLAKQAVYMIEVGQFQ